MGRLILLALLLLVTFLLLRLGWNLLRKIVQSLIKVALVLGSVAGAAVLAAWAGLIAFLVLPIAIVGDGFGISIFFVATLVFVLCLRKLIRRKRPADRQLAMAEEESVASPAVVEQAFEPEADPRIIVAWKIAGELAPEYEQRLSVARRGCAQLLELATGDSVEWSIIDCSTFISRTIPDAVAAAAALMKDAELSERRRLADELVAELERLARRAREDVDSRRHQLRNNWNIIRTHIASRTVRDAFSERGSGRPR